MQDLGKILIVMAGAPGSGKSTIAEEVSQHFGIDLVCPDMIRFELFGDASVQRDGWLVFERAYRYMNESLDDEEGIGVIFDATNCNAKLRRKLLFQADGGYSCAVCAVSSVDLDTCLERNASRDRQVPEDVIVNMHKSLWNCWPSTDEGFDYVIDVDELWDFMEDYLAGDIG